MENWFRMAAGLGWIISPQLVLFLSCPWLRFEPNLLFSTLDIKGKIGRRLEGKSEKRQTSATIGPLSFPRHCQHRPSCCLVIWPFWPKVRLTVPHGSPPACRWVFRFGGFAYSPEKHLERHLKAYSVFSPLLSWPLCALCSSLEAGLSLSLPSARSLFFLLQNRDFCSFQRSEE